VTPPDPDPDRWYEVGDQILNSSPTTGGYIGWVCTSRGKRKDAKWTPYGKID